MKLGGLCCGLMKTLGHLGFVATFGGDPSQAGPLPATSPARKVSKNKTVETAPRFKLLY